MPGLVVLVVSVLVAFTVHDVLLSSNAWTQRTEVLISGIAIALSTTTALAYLAWRGRAVTVEDTARTCIVAAGISLTVLAGVGIAGNVRFPADILLWSESEFVNDIIKLRSGYPLFTAQTNNESFCYMPGAQITTWLIASALGLSDSIVAFRAIQIGFTIAAAVVATVTVFRILQLAGVRIDARRTALWSAALVPVLFLVEHNTSTSLFNSMLHNDALNSLVSAVALWLLLEWTVSRRPIWLMALVLIPLAGFFVKQTSVVWAALVPLYLAFADREPSWVRAIRFAGVAGLLIVLAFAACYAWWGQDFIYWIFIVLRSHGVTPIRSLYHGVQISAFFAALALGGVVVLQVTARRAPEALRPVVGLWTVCALLLITQTYTSGLAYMLNHIGPACLLATTWGMTGVIVLWECVIVSASRSASTRISQPLQWVTTALAAIGVILGLPQLDLVRLPEMPYGRDAYRYVRELEGAARGVAPQELLVDIGSWLYLPGNVVQKDRATNIGERGFSASGDFSGMIARVEQHAYRRIIVRHFHQDDMWYDSAVWPRSSGIRKALETQYHEVATIDAVKGPRTFVGYLMDDVSVLEPNAPAPPPSPSK